MQVIKLTWLGTRTTAAEATAAFFRDIMGLSEVFRDTDFWVLRMPDGGTVEVFGPASEHNHHFTTGPVGGFLVADLDAALDELRAAGTPILFDSGAASPEKRWIHFRAPDGNVYELTDDPGATSPA